MKISIPIYKEWVGYTKDVDVELIDVAPHLAHIATFGVGPSVDFGCPRWRIHHLETGAYLPGCDARSKRAAIEAARKLLSTVTTSRYHRRVAKIRKKYAIA